MDPDDLKNLKTDTQVLSSDYVKKIAEDPKNIVYEYVDDSDKLERIKPAKEVLSLINQARKEYFDRRKRVPTWNDDIVRESIKKECPTLADFSKSHPIFFSKCTDRETTAENMRHMYQMVAMRHNQEFARPGFQDEESVKQKVWDYLFKNMSRESPDAAPAAAGNFTKAAHK